MNRKCFVCLTLALTVLFSSLAGVTLAQEPEPPVDDEPGSTSSVAITSPPAMRVGENAALLAAAFSGAPVYDSGWVTLAQDEAKTLTHNLGGNTDNYVVDMQYKYSSTVNQRYYGGADFGANVSGMENHRVGAYWRSLTDSAITVYRRPEDTFAAQVRIRIWIDSSPDYVSGWVSMAPGAAATAITHNLGGNTDDYVVDMQYRHGSTINQRYYGGADFGTSPAPGHGENDRVALYWRTLTNSTITLFRRAEDNYADDVRVRIWVRPNPTYDSGWVSVNQDETQTLTHNLSGNPEDYVVDMQYRSQDTNGVNQRYYGGADFGDNPPSGMNADDRVGAYWRSLTNSSITVYRRPEDIYAPEVRIRIWHFPESQFPVPGYDSGWTAINQGQAIQSVHNLGGDVDDYLVDLSFKDGAGFNGINQRAYGGMDRGANYPPADNRDGAYWRHLTGTDIYVFRRTEDTYADEVRVRIWVMPSPTYDSGWTAINQNQALQFIHNLGSDPENYLVDLSFKDGDNFNGINQRAYGGMDRGANYPPADNRDGAYWRHLTDTDIYVYRRAEDAYADEVRVRIWVKPWPDYDSGWTAISTEEALQFLHNLGGNPDNYLVELSFKDDNASFGICHRAYGGMDLASDNRDGAYWRHLTDTDIYAYRRAEDTYADEVRFRIWVTPYHIYLPLVVRNY